MAAFTIELDPEITEDDVAAAHDAPASDYDVVHTAHLSHSGQDDLNELGAGTTAATPVQAIANARHLSLDDVWVDVGYCLRTVRGPEWLVGPLFPDAETAYEQADKKHPQTDPNKIPRGAVVYWLNDGHGHVATSAGGGMCWTTDYRRPGYVDLAPIVNLASWCSGRLVGWAEDLNGVDVWPTSHHQHTILDRKRKLHLLHVALTEARVHHRQHRVELLQEWIDRLEKGHHA